jgi:hypothetical protein
MVDDSPDVPVGPSKHVVPMEDEAGVQHCPAPPVLTGSSLPGARGASSVSASVCDSAGPVSAAAVLSSGNQRTSVDSTLSSPVPAFTSTLAEPAKPAPLPVITPLVAGQGRGEGSGRRRSSATQAKTVMCDDIVEMGPAATTVPVLLHPSTYARPDARSAAVQECSATPLAPTVRSLYRTPFPESSSADAHVVQSRPRSAASAPTALGDDSTLSLLELQEMTTAVLGKVFETKNEVSSVLPLLHTQFLQHLPFSSPSRCQVPVSSLLSILLSESQRAIPEAKVRFSLFLRSAARQLLYFFVLLQFHSVLTKLNADNVILLAPDLPFRSNTVVHKI